MKTSLLCFALLWVSLNKIFAQAPPADIPDADVSDENTPLPIKKATDTNQDSLSKSFSYRLYTISTFDYSPLKGGAQSFLGGGGLFNERAARQELNGEITLHPSGNLTLKADSQALYSTAFAEGSRLFDKGAQDWVKINEVFVEYYPATQVSFLVGKYRRIFGPGLFQNPMDRYNPVSALPGQPVEREGAYIAQMAYSREMSYSWWNMFQIQAAFLPQFPQNKYGIPEESRVVYTVNTKAPPSEALNRTRERYDLKDAGGFLRFYMNIFEGDLNLMVYSLERQTQTGASYSRYFADWFEVHFEALVYPNSHLDGHRAQTVFADFLGGIRIEPNQDYGLVLEYLRHGDAPEEYPMNFDERLQFIGRLLSENVGQQFFTPLRDYFLASVYWREIKDTYAFILNTIYGPKQNEVLVSFRQEAEIGENGKISLIETAFQAESGSFYYEAVPFEYRISTEVQLSF